MNRGPCHKLMKAEHESMMNIFQSPSVKLVCIPRPSGTLSHTYAKYISCIACRPGDFLPCAQFQHRIFINKLCCGGMLIQFGQLVGMFNVLRPHRFPLRGGMKVTFTYHFRPGLITGPLRANAGPRRSARLPTAPPTPCGHQ